MAKRDARKGDRHRPGYSEAYKRETYTQINVRLRKDSGIAEALELACQITGMPRSEYIRDALEDRLRDDGYLPEK